ncbi:hypothetical protein [Chryseobacterium bernardetii]|uniref:hypothetical protein n=1 Tax=Chryseobacterium bernardetii TaxID=1241978 RepID=UPI001E582AFE|nr:hypothetical protein [Chryseobacterium bernardetii]
MAIEDIADKTKPIDALKGLMKQSLLRDEGWKEFYVEEMNSIAKPIENSSIYEMLVLERDAYLAGYIGNYEKACEKIQKLLMIFVGMRVRKVGISKLKLDTNTLLVK